MNQVLNIQPGNTLHSLVNCQKKRSWTPAKPNARLTGSLLAAILTALPHCSTGLASWNTSGTAATIAVFLCAKKLSSSSLCRAGWALVRVAGARTGRPTCPVRHHDCSHVVGFTTLRDITMTNHTQQNPLVALFSIYHERKLIASNVLGIRALRLKLYNPALIVKFDRMGGAA